jgi:hypothetical protein
MLYSYFLIIIYYFLSVVFVFVSLVFFKYQCQNRYFQFNLQKKKIILMIDHIYIYIYFGTIYSFSWYKIDHIYLLNERRRKKKLYKLINEFRLKLV